MDKQGLAELIIDHPKALGVVLAVAVAFSAYRVYELGLHVGTLRSMRFAGDGARRASEALGG